MRRPSGWEMGIPHASPQAPNVCEPPSVSGRCVPSGMAVGPFNQKELPAFASPGGAAPLGLLGEGRLGFQKASPVALFSSVASTRGLNQATKPSVSFFVF